MKRALPRLIKIILFVSVTGGCALGGKTPTPASAPGEAPRTFVYVGSPGAIEVMSVQTDAAGGPIDVTARSRVTADGTPAAFASLPFGKTLVALDEKAATLVAYDVDPASGALHAAVRGASGGSRPGRTIIDRSGKYILVTNQASASVAVLAVGPGARLSSPNLFPAGAGAFGLALHPSNTVAFVANAKAGTLSQLTFNEGTGALTAKLGAAIGLPWGSGPKLVICHPRGRWIYVLNDSNNTVSVHAFDDRMGTVSRLAFQVVAAAGEANADKATADKASAGKATAGKSHARELVLGPSGHFLYVLDGARDVVTTFAVDDETGGLSEAGQAPSGGTGAVGLAVDPSGQFLVVVHQNSRHVAVFRLDGKTGLPTLADSTRANGAPVSVAVIKPARQ
jgi:6-phosphogluconolactonase